MIQHPWLLGATFLGIAFGIHALHRHPRMARCFDVIPMPLWCFAVPMAASAAGALPMQSPLYAWCSRQVLPVALGLLVMGSDLRGVLQVGGRALGLLFVGAAGIVAGVALALLLWGRWLPADAWQGLAALAATWTGGSMNFLAMKEALGLSDTAVAPLIITDSCITYSWMALLLAGARSVHAQPSPFAGPHSNVPSGTFGAAARPRESPEGDTMLARPPRAPSKRMAALGFVLLLTLALSLAAQWVAGRLPSLAGLTSMTWTVLIVTTVALGLSMTYLGEQARQAPVPDLGNVLLIVLLGTMGARANLRGILDAPIFLLAGITTVATHAGLLLLAGRVCYVPRGLLATVSQANLGGVISAPMVAAAYEAKLVPVGLLLAVLGNVIGTYVGLLTACLGRWILT